MSGRCLICNQTNSTLTMKIFGGKNRIADPNFVAAFDKVYRGEVTKLKTQLKTGVGDATKISETLDKYVFSSNNYKIPSDIFNYLARQRRGFDFYSGSEDPKIHDLILSHWFVCRKEYFFIIFKFICTT